MQIFLKAKCVSLAQEQRLLRRYMRSLQKRARERETPPVVGDGFYTKNERAAFDGLYKHSTKELAPNIRHSHLALGFLRKKQYPQMEQACRKLPDWDEIERMVTKFSIDDPRTVKQQFAEWRDSSDTYAQRERKNLLAKDQNLAAERRKHYKVNNTDGARVARKLHWEKKITGDNRA